VNPFPYSGEVRKIPTLLGPLEGANLNQQTSPPNRVSSSPDLKMETDPTSETLCFLVTYNSGRRPKPINPVNLDQGAN
jgi:hypothetical protein